MSKENVSKKILLPFVMRPTWISELTVLLLLGLGFFVDAVIVYFGVTEPIDLRDWHAIVALAMCALFVLMWVPLWFLCLGNITCDELGMTISVFGFTISKIKWKSIRKVKYSEIASPGQAQPRYLIYHDGSMLGFPTWINNFMYRREDLADFLFLLRQKTVGAKLSKL